MMTQLYLQCTSSHFVFFLTLLVSQCHLWNLRPYTSLLSLFLSSISISSSVAHYRNDREYITSWIAQVLITLMRFQLWSLILIRCPWCNGYRRKKWTRRHEFKSWTRLIAFHLALIPLGKVWIQLFSLQLWVNSRTDWVLQPWWGN